MIPQEHFPPNLDGLEFQTAEGLWRTAYIGQPRKLSHLDVWFYEIRFKWIDPNHPENLATPEHRLHLQVDEVDLIQANAEELLVALIDRWIQAPYPPCEARFDYQRRQLAKPRAEDQP